jgi:hypothetical protein
MLIDPIPMLLRPAFDLSISMLVVLGRNTSSLSSLDQMGGLFNTASARQRDHQNLGN